MIQPDRPRGAAGVEHPGVRPGLRRNDRIQPRLHDQSERGLRLIFGADPSPDEIAAYWAVNDLGAVVPRLKHLSDDDLRATLTTLCLRNLTI